MDNFYAQQLLNTPQVAVDLDVDSRTVWSSCQASRAASMTTSLLCLVYLHSRAF